MLKTTLVLVIEHSKPIPQLTDIAAGRIYTLDGVEDVTTELQPEPPVAKQAREELETRLRSMSRTLANIASDPMWSDHAEISKRTLNRASEVMTLALSALASQSTPEAE